MRNFKMYKWFFLIYVSMAMDQALSEDSDYNILNTDGSYDFRYDNPDSYHESHANRNNIVNGAFGGRNPGTGAIDRTEYTAGPRGFRPKGKNIVRKYNLSQRKTGPIGNKDDPYFDPNEDPSYNFQFNTRSYSRKEGANSYGDVKGSYTYLDDVGDKHEVEYIAGKNTGFHVKTPHPDSYPNAYRGVYFKDPRKPYMRGRSFVQRGLDGSYRFAAVGPDQRRTEVSDSVGNVRGSYTYKDEKGVQHSVHYIAGPNIGYRVLKNVKGPHLPTFFPFNSPDIVPPDFYDAKEESDVFAQAASTYVTPKPNKDNDHFISDGVNQIDKSTVKPIIQSESSTIRPIRPTQISSGDNGEEDDEELFDDLFNSGVKPAPVRPTAIKPSTYRPPISQNRPQATSTSKPQAASSGSSGFKPSGSSGSSGINTSSFTAEPSDSNESGGFGGKPSGSAESVFGTKPSTSGENVFDSDSSDFEPDDDIFGTSSSGVYGTKPSLTGSGQRPKPSLSSNNQRPGSSVSGANQRPRPPASGGNRRPGSFSNANQRPGSSFNNGGQSSKPSIISSGQIPSSPSPADFTKPVLQFDLASSGEDGRFHTVITNLGDTLFTAPPGVPVRAHVQSIGLIPLYPRSPSPSEQYNVEISRSLEEIDSEPANSHLNLASTKSTYTPSVTSPQSSTISTTIHTTEATTSPSTSTTALPETTTKS